MKMDKILTIAGNLECADCNDSGKGVVRYCSVKLGVFLCNQCYAAHRALGAHITRAKCVGLDSFTQPELQLLASVGNTKANALYEANLHPGDKPPPTPCNGCSSTKCLDCSQRLQFVRDKYELKRWYAEKLPVAIEAAPSARQGSAVTDTPDCLDLLGLDLIATPAPTTALATTVLPDLLDLDMFSSPPLTSVSCTMSAANTSNDIPNLFCSPAPAAPQHLTQPTLQSSPTFMLHDQAPESFIAQALQQPTSQTSTRGSGSPNAPRFMDSGAMSHVSTGAMASGMSSGYTGSGIGTSSGHESMPSMRMGELSMGKGIVSELTGFDGRVCDTAKQSGSGTDIFASFGLL